MQTNLWQYLLRKKRESRNRVCNEKDIADKKTENIYNEKLNAEYSNLDGVDKFLEKCNLSIIQTHVQLI